MYFPPVWVQAPARQASIKAGLPKSVQATTVNKVCGSGMQTVIMGAEALASGTVDYVVAGGMESMTNAPYLLKKHRSGARIGHDTTYDHMFLDGLEDAYEEGRAMGTFAQDTANEYQLTREQQDEYSIESLQRRANAAIEAGGFADEVVPVTFVTRKGEVTVDADEQPGKGRPDKIPQLRAAFAKDGTITAATSSSISDGAAAVVLTRESLAKENGQNPVAKVVAMAAHAREPKDFTIAPVGAIEKVLANAGWTTEDVDLWEVNEAFACVAMFAMRDIGIPHEKINVNGGATALGHPIGASGTRIIVTLINALKKQGKTKGVASLCIGGGEATAIAVELNLTELTFGRFCRCPTNAISKSSLLGRLRPTDTNCPGNRLADQETPGSTRHRIRASQIRAFAQFGTVLANYIGRSLRR